MENFDEKLNYATSKMFLNNKETNTRASLNHSDTVMILFSPPNWVTFVSEKVMSHRLFSMLSNALFCCSSCHLHRLREAHVTVRGRHIENCNPSSDPSSNCGGVLASLSTSPRLGLMGQQGCADNVFYFCVIIRGRQVFEQLLSDEPLIHDTARWWCLSK